MSLSSIAWCPPVALVDTIVGQLPSSFKVTWPDAYGLPAYDDEYPFIHHIENGSYHAKYAIAERKATGWQVELRSVVYDFGSMARLAQSRQRPDWVVALRTGRMG